MPRKASAHRPPSRLGMTPRDRRLWLRISGTFCRVAAPTCRTVGAAACGRATVMRGPESKQECLRRLEDFHRRHADRAPAALERLRRAALEDGGNLFAELLRATEVCSLGQITHALYEVGGEYRRNL